MFGPPRRGGDARPASATPRATSKPTATTAKQPASAAAAARPTSARPAAKSARSRVAIGASRSSPSKSSAAVTPIHLSAATSHSPSRILYPVLFQCIFAFCRMRDVSAAVSVCRHWASVVHSMPPLLCAVICKSPFKPMCSSSLARHIGRIESSHAANCSATLLAMFTARLPNLQCLEWFLTVEACRIKEDQPMMFPARLRTLELTFPQTCVASMIDHILLAVSRSCLQLQHLKLLLLTACGPDGFGALSRFECLSKLPLRTLTLLEQGTTPHTWKQPGIAFHPAQIHAIRSMPCLESLVLKPIRNEAMLWSLIETPHQMRWTAMPEMAEWTLEDVGTARLADSLPTLTALPPLTLAPDASSLLWLAKLPALSSLDLRLNGCHLSGTETMSGLQSCTSMLDLALSSPSHLSWEQLQIALQAMPLLRTLKLGLWHSSLAFLVVPSLARTLQDLTLHDFTMEVEELQFIHTLQALRTLRLLRCFERPSPPALWAFSVPSEVMPNLDTFTQEAKFMKQMASYANYGLLQRLGGAY